MKKGHECWIFLALAAILIVLILQFVVMKSQRDILEDSLIPNKPVIDLWDSYGPIRAYQYDAVLDGVEDKLYVSVLNIGKMTLPWVNITIKETEYFQGKPDYGLGIISLPSMENKTISLGFEVKPEMKDSIQPGIHEIKFRIKCPACKEQQTYDSFKICLYESHPSRNCGPVWSW